ncbi:MAG: 16S rRNA (guanine(527)-N(7))-methyltransferase RsmG [Rhodothermales bacterium]|nr:16S rRNA (guanine(527)-N(7))-methyltransferase RsmG [Rhodothermales bacterium]
MTHHARLLPAGLDVSPSQIDLLDAFGRELRRMNKRINLVSSETESEFWKRHTAHCLALATRSFPEGARIVDWGSGGGLPAIPLAIMFPQCRIMGVDSVEKKVRSCTAIARRLGLENCEFIHGRAETVHLMCDYSVSRATAPLATLWAWHRRVAAPVNAGTDGADPEPAMEPPDTDRAPVWERGLICLKGGDLQDEIDAMLESARQTGSTAPGVQTIPLGELFDDPWYQQKVILQVA